MSSLLGEAIIDAKALRESALKNAEASVIEKYSDEVKNVLEQLLEQEDVDPLASLNLDDPTAAAGSALEETTADSEEITEDEIPLAATNGFSNNEGENLSSLAESGEDVEINIDLGALQEAISQLATEVEEGSIDEADAKPDYLDLDKDGDKEEPMKKAAEDAEEVNEEMDIDIDPSAAEEEADNEAMSGLDNLDEEESSLDALVDAVMEKLEVDTGFELSGWGGRPTSQLRLGQERELAREASTEEETLDEKEELDENYVALRDENKTLIQQVQQYREIMGELKENLFEVNLSNARLLYTNRVLRNSSLNERQKDKIVEAIAKAETLKEAKTLYQTLKETTVGTPRERGPKSLSESVQRKQVLSAHLPRRKQENTIEEQSFASRMKKLAGID